MNIRNFILASILLLGTFAASAQQQEQLLGIWQDAKFPEKQVEIVKEQGAYQGLSAKNRSQKVFRSLVWDQRSQTYSGYIINPDNAKAHLIEIVLVDQNTFEFTVGAFLFKKTFRFQRL